MNRKGFTLIELLAVIILISIISVLIVPSILDNVNSAKQISYNTLIENIKTSSQTYYEECEYGDLSNEKYGSYACSISNNTITTTLGVLANTGFLSVSDTKTVDSKEIKVVINPTNNKDISNCQIKIQKNIEEIEDINGITNYKVTYEIIRITEEIEDGIECPTY